MPRASGAGRPDGDGDAGGDPVADVRLASGHAIGFGMGLAKGPAIVGRIGYEGRSDYTAIGNVVNLASRICGAAEDGQILVDAAMAAEIGAALPLAPLGTRTLRGFAEAVPVFSVGLPSPSLTKIAADG